MNIFRRFISIFHFAWILLAIQAHAEERVEVTSTGETVADNNAPPSTGGCDCTAEIQAATAPLLQAKDALDVKLTTSITELDEIIEERNRLLEEIKRLRESLHTARKEMENLRSSLENEKTAKDSLKQQMVSSEAQMASLKQELNDARAEIKRLNEISFIVNFRREVAGLWDRIVQLARKTIAKKK